MVLGEGREVFRIRIFLKAEPAGLLTMGCRASKKDRSQRRPQGFWLNKKRTEGPSAQPAKAVGGDSFGEGEIRNLGSVGFEMPVRYLNQDLEWVFGYIRPKSRKEV